MQAARHGGNVLLGTGSPGSLEIFADPLVEYPDNDRKGQVLVTEIKPENFFVNKSISISIYE